MANVIDTCALCLSTTRLMKSHVIPKWAFTRARSIPPPSTSGIPNAPVDQRYLWINAAEMKDASTQFTEHLLCRDCETRIALSERAVSVLVRQDDGSFLALSSCVPATLLPGLYSLYSLDTDALLRFGVSVLWRASAAKRFSNVVFGERYHDAFREYLLDDHSVFPRGAVMSLKLIDPRRLDPDMATQIDPLLDCLVTHPAMHRLDGRSRIYTFIVLGMHFTLALGEVPPELGASCFALTECVEIVDGSEFRSELIRLGVSAVRRTLGLPERLPE